MHPTAMISAGGEVSKQLLADFRQLQIWIPIIRCRGMKVGSVWLPLKASLLWVAYFLGTDTHLLCRRKQISLMGTCRLLMHGHVGPDALLLDESTWHLWRSAPIESPMLPQIALWPVFEVRVVNHI